MKQDINICVPPMLLRKNSPGGFFRANATFLSMVGFSETEMMGKPFLHWIDPLNIEAAQMTLADEKESCLIGHRTRGGDFLPMEMKVVDQGGESLIMARGLQMAEETIGPEDSEDEATVIGTLHTITRILEEQNPGFKCSILLVADGKFVRGAGPSLPEDYNDAIDGYAIGPTVGSCGTAIYWNIPVIVEDIQADPLWKSLNELASKAGVAACWSYPFASKNGNVLGALAFYSPEPLSPTPEQLGRLRAAALMTGLAVERGRAEESLRENRKRELELEEQLRQAAKMEALGVLAGGIAHDFNNVLATIMANAEFGRELLPADSAVHEMLRDIVDASKRAGLFCQQMLDYAGCGVLSNSIIEMGALVPQINALFKPTASNKITLKYALLEDPVYVEGDKNQLLQVLMNLVTNASEAIGDDEGEITLRSELENFDENQVRHLDPQVEFLSGEYLIFSVSDTGAGFDTQTAARIFDPFFTTKPFGHGPGYGHGLGLSAVKGIVRRHGGTIQIESVVNVGTTFKVILPTVTQFSTEVEKPAIPFVASKEKVILVADDENALREVISRNMNHMGFKTLVACDGQEAVELFKKHQDSIDCVLLDYAMPRLNGGEAQQAIHAIRPDVPIVIMSGYNEQEVVDRFRDVGIAGFLQKPAEMRIVAQTIRRAMGLEGRRGS
ncbi:MAG: response regulator [bacterium]|nr:response regulator [bacterium]